MADHQPGHGQPNGSGPATGGSSFLRKLRDHVPNSIQSIGFLTLVISVGILLILTGLTLTATVLALIFFTPLILLTSPIWVPTGTLLFFVIAGFLLIFGFGFAVLSVLSWTYNYCRGRHPMGSDSVDYARSRIVDTASHLMDYARGYGEYSQNKVKDAAPGA